MHGGLLVTVHLSPQREHSRFEPWLGKLFCVHGCGGVTYHGLASHLGGVEVPLVASCYRIWEKLRLDGPLASGADFTLAT